MRNDGGGQGAAAGGRANGFIPSSFRAISSYFRIVSSGASTVASTVRSAASSIVERDDDARHDQVIWAGFDKLECERDVIRRVLLLGYRSGFQVWDVEEADNVCDLVSRHDGPVSFLQMLPKPVSSAVSGDKFSDSRPLLVVCADGALPPGSSIQDGKNISFNGTIPNGPDSGNASHGPCTVRFYSLRSQTYVHVLKFRSAVYSVRCSSRVIAVSQAAQIHCFNAATLEREYSFLMNPVVMASPGAGGIGYGPLAVGPRWLAYSGSPVMFSNSGRVRPQHLTSSATFSSPVSNGSVVAHYAKESSKQLAAGIVTLSDMGYKKLSRYCSELLLDSNHSMQNGSSGWKTNGTINGHLLDAETVGMVIVRDVVSKSVVTQFRAHKSPISSLCFDPSGTLLVTASVQGHSINVFRIMPGHPGALTGSDASGSHVHLYRLQRGFTNAVIQDISFSNDSHWIMISSSRGTNHLFAISPSGGVVNLQFVDASSKNGLSFTNNQAVHWPPNAGSQSPKQAVFCSSGPPITLSAVSRIRSGSNGWRSTVTGAAAAATGRIGLFSGAVASSFHHCVGSEASSSMMEKYHLLVFSPSGSLIQYVLQVNAGLDLALGATDVSPASESSSTNDPRLMVVPIQRWNICQKETRREREDNVDIYGENGNSDSVKIFPEGSKKLNGIYPVANGAVTKSKISHEERHHIYISEAELQMHEPWIPFWAKSEIYFQSMMIDGTKMDEENGNGGEIEIERISARTIEARSKNLVPVFDYIQNPKSRRERIATSDTHFGPRLVHQVSGMSQNSGLSSRSSSSSLGSMTESGAAAAELHNGNEQTVDGLLKPPDTCKGVVNNDTSPSAISQLEIVNNRDRQFVNNNNEPSEMENQFEDEGEEFD